MNYSKRRQELATALPNNSIAYIFSGEAPMRSNDETYPFCVNRNFFYLTGIDEENMVLVLSKLDEEIHEILFILPFDEALARWVGDRMKNDEATSISGVEDIRDIAGLDDYFASLYARSLRYKDFSIYLDLWRQQFNQRYAPGIAYSKRLLKRYPNLDIQDIYPFITKQRLVKDEDEINAIKKAIKITKTGIDTMMRTIKPGMNETQLEATFDFALKQQGCRENAFDTIAASGIRATTLHYHANNCVVEDGELFLADLGASYNHYCADISRTFPVNGKFSERQKELYELVLQVQQLVQDNAKPGVSIKDLQQMVIDFYKEELPKHNLNEPVSEYYFHGIGHQLGLDTHDLSLGNNEVLQVGNVITNEPGLYIRDEKIGIRIEDDLLICEDGCINLSEDIIKSVEDIEKLMNQ